MVVILRRPNEVERKDMGLGGMDTLFCCVPKHRNGRTGEVGLHFDRPLQRMHALAIHGEPPPTRDYMAEEDDDDENDGLF